MQKGAGVSRIVTAALALVTIAGLTVACSDDSDGPSNGSDDSTPSDAGTELDDGAPEEADLEAFCAGFPELGGGGGETQAFTAEQWELRIANVEGIAANAPAEMRDEAEAYAEMMQLRADLAAENGYVAASDLDPAVRQEFIAEVGALQAEVNELIAYSREACDLA